MATIERGNWSFSDPGDDISSGDIINGGNFSQLEPETEILVGKTLTINGGNWTNVKAQQNWTINGGNWKQFDFCTHEMPFLIERGVTECVENCAHVVDTDTVIVDGEEMTIYHHKSTRM